MSELDRLLRSTGEPTADSLAAFLQRQPATLDVPTDLQPLLLHAQLTHWLRAHEDGARHSNPLQSHALTLVHWGSHSQSAAAPSAQHLTPAQLIRLAYAVSNLHDASLQHEFETTLVELKRQLVLDRLVHDTPLDELNAWLRGLFPLAASMPSEAASASAHSAALADLGSVWYHAPSADAVAQEEEVVGELQSLLRPGAHRDAAKNYLSEHPLAEFIERALEWLALARQQWIDAHPQPTTALVQPVAAVAAGSPQPRAKKTAASAVSPAASPTAAVAASAAPSKATLSWRWDSLELSTIEVEDLLPPSLYTSYPVPSGLRASLANELASGDLGDAEQREAWLAKRAMFQAIHEQTLDDIVLFQQQQQPTLPQSAGVADGSRKRPKRKVTSTRRAGVQPDPATVAAAPVAPAPSAAASAASSSRRTAEPPALFSQRSCIIETHADLMLTQQPAAPSDEEEDDRSPAEGGVQSGSGSDLAVEDEAPPSEDEGQPPARSLQRKPSASHRARAAAKQALNAPQPLPASSKSIDAYFQPRHPSPSAAAAHSSPAGKRQKR